MRHGYADNSSPDSARKLTNFGKERIFANQSLLKSHIDNLDYVITSPYKRASDTAKLMHKMFDVKSNLMTDKYLKPGARISNILILLKTLEAESVLLVGHMPDVSNLTLNLIDSEIIDLPFSPGSIAGISINGKLSPGTGTLKFLLPLE